MSQHDNVPGRANGDASPPLVQARQVSKTFGQPRRGLNRWVSDLMHLPPKPVVHAVDGVSLTINKGEVVGLVGESGCGKSTLGRIVAGLIPPSEGTVHFGGSDAAAQRGSNTRRRRERLKTQMIFQNPMASLNPRMPVKDIIMEAPRVHGLVTTDPDAYLAMQMERAGLNPAYRDRLPHQFSGGQRQRIGIARALAVQPELLICDESVAALDVSIQAQILNLFMRLREELALTYLFISHDLGVVRHISDRVMIMYLGRIVEEAPTESLFSQPRHPYTAALLAEVPRIETAKRSFSAIAGELPSPLAPPPGCHFHPRCPQAMPRCREQAPVLREVAPGHRSACHLTEDAQVIHFHHRPDC